MNRLTDLTFNTNAVINLLKTFDYNNEDIEDIKREIIIMVNKAHQDRNVTLSNLSGCFVYLIADMILTGHKNKDNNILESIYTLDCLIEEDDEFFASYHKARKLMSEFAKEYFIFLKSSRNNKQISDFSVKSLFISRKLKKLADLNRLDNPLTIVEEIL